jgi:CBS domain-containing protein
MPIFVKDVMSKPVYTIGMDKTAKDAAVLMRKTRKGALIVTKSNHPVGIVTADDIVYKLVSKNKRPSVKIKDILSEPLVTISQDDTVSEASRKMRSNKIKRLPVVDNGRLVGILSFTDIATVVPEFVDYLEERMSMESGSEEIKEPTTTGICDNCDKYSDYLKLEDDDWLCEDCREDKEF